MNRRRMMDRMPITSTLRYADARRVDATKHLPPWRWWMAPICWIAGHAWPIDGPVLLCERLCHCRRCGEEFDARTR